jgi:hypothetical protein
MTEKALLALAVKELLSPKGKKLLGTRINVKEITNKISSLSNKFNIDLTVLAASAATAAAASAVAIASKDSDKVDQTKTAKERINDKKESVKNTKKKLIQRAKDEIIALKNKLKSEIPVIEEFEIKGRIFDKITGDVLQGVKVELGVSVAGVDIDAGIDVDIPNPTNSPVELVTPIPNFEFNAEVYAPIPGQNTITDKQGSFSIKVKLPIIPKNQKTPLKLGLLYTKSGFVPSSAPIINGDQTIKSNLQASSLINLDKAAKNISKEYNDKVDEAQKLVKAIAMNPKLLVISASKLAIDVLVGIIKTKTIPMAVGILIAFGISKLSQSNRKTCPTPEELEELIRKRNRLVRQLNQIFAKIVASTALAVAFKTLSATLKGVSISLDSIPLPQAIGTPPAKDFGGLIFAQTYSTTAKLRTLTLQINELSKSSDELSKATLVALVFLIAAAATVIILLNGLDKLMQECAEENGVTQVELTAINQELLDLAEEQEEDGNPIIKSVNGFVFSVETDNSNPIGSLKRRFAVAKDNRGVTLLKGQPSFSSNDQILIDELIFYIQQNDLKAY